MVSVQLHQRTPFLQVLVVVTQRSHSAQQALAPPLECRSAVRLIDLDTDIGPVRVDETEAVAALAEWAESIEVYDEAGPWPG
jgi:hypothetical protein